MIIDDSTPSRTCPVSIESTSLLDEKILADPWEFYAQLHAECPVYKMPETGIYVVTKHEDVASIMRDTETFSNVILAMEALQGDNGRRYQEMLKEKGRNVRRLKLIEADKI